MSELTDVLAKNNINMKAISLADTSDFGIARIIVDNPEEVAKMLEDNEYLVKITIIMVNHHIIEESLNLKNKNIKYLNH